MAVRKKISIPSDMLQRGTSRSINRADATVFDFMPVLLGDQFRTDRTLSMQLFRYSPINGPFMLMEEAYSLLGQRYLNQGERIPALECYKFFLQQKTGFIGFVSSMQENALLSPGEISHLQLESPFEEDLMTEISRGGKGVNSNIYYAWLDKIRAEKRLEREYNKDGDEGFKRPNLELQLSMGMYGDGAVFGVEYHVEVLGEDNFIRRVDIARPGEILDIEWLKKYVDENHPESTICG